MTGKTRIAIVAALVLAVLPAALSPALGKTAYQAPRLADGRPDLGGVWDNSSLTALQRNVELGGRRAYTEQEAKDLEKRYLEHPGTYADYIDPVPVMRVAGEPRTSLITDPADGRVPVPKGGQTPAETAFNGERQSFNYGLNDRVSGVYDIPEERPPFERCITSFGQSAGPVMLSQQYNNHYQVVQGRDTVAIWVEMIHDVRIVRIGGKHRTDGVRPYMGDSIGHYEGQTLIVETTNFPATTNFFGAGPNLTMVEQFTRVSPDRMLYQFEVRDPTVWSRPWGGEYEFQRGRRSYESYEYACHEGNYQLEDNLKKARAAAR